jgi:hypothetical protein
MRVIIAGSRSIKVNGEALAMLEEFIEVVQDHHSFVITEIVSGHAAGGDQLGESYAMKHSIPVKLFPAKWKQFGLAAGPIRNRQMRDYADALIALWDGRSPGTHHMIRIAREKGMPTFVKIVG